MTDLTAFRARDLVELLRKPSSAARHKTNAAPSEDEKATRILGRGWMLQRKSAFLTFNPVENSDSRPLAQSPLDMSSSSETALPRNRLGLSESPMAASASRTTKSVGSMDGGSIL